MVALASRILRRGQADAEQADVETPAARPKSDQRQVEFDLFMQVSYMAALATARVSRDVLFSRAATLDLASTPYFRDVQTLASRLSVDYSKACQVIASRTDDAAVSELLLRMSGSLAAGEDEAEFLTREAKVLAEQYGEKYERDIESLKKWTDAYSALVVSVGLVVIISIISMMLYEISTGFLVVVALTAVTSTGLGGWIIYLSSPKESFVRSAGLSAAGQRRAMFLFKVFFPSAAAIGALLLLVGGGAGTALLLVGAALVPAGFLMNRDARKIAKSDADIAVMVRLLGAVTSAIGTTPTEALGKIERRSMSTLEPEIAKLETRLKAGIKSEVCWNRFVDDSGSEIVDRSVKIFTDAVAAGGEPGEIGEKASFFAQRIVLLREKRALVAGTFGYLIPLMHAAVVGLLVFIVNVLGLFSTKLLEATPDASSGLGGQAVPAVGLSTFTTLDVGFLNLLVTGTVVALTIANGFVMSVVSGGHWLRMAYSYGQTTLIAGMMMVLIPRMSESVFTSITANPT